MKYLFCCCLASFAIVSCSSNSGKKTTADGITTTDTVASSKTIVTTDSGKTVSSLCFLRTDGKNNRDSTSIELVVKGSKVTGTMNWLPYQKDSRKGMLDGTLKGDTINAVWNFMQEGIKDTLNLKFRLQNQTLAQQPLKLNAKTGREQTDASAPYSLSYSSINKIHH